MAVSPACLAAVRAAVGDKITEAEAQQVIQAVEAMQKRLEAEGKVAGAEDLLRQRAAEAAEEVKIEAALKKKHAALTAMKRVQLEEWVDRYLALRPGKFKDAVVSLLEGSTRAIEGARRSVNTVTMAFRSRYEGSVLGAIQKERPHLLKMLRDRDFNERVALEMGELREGGTPGLTGDKDAQWLAKVYADVAELSRRDLNKRGANIGKLDGWRPQTHDPFRLLKVSADKWVGDVLPLLDLGKTFKDVAPEDVPGILHEIYKTLVTGQDRETRATGEFKGPPNVARKLGHHRVLHFRDTAAWLAYNESYGMGTLSASMFAHLHRAARYAAQMEVLGPNPGAMMEWLTERLKLKARDELDLKQIRELSTVEDWPAWRVMTGAATTPVNHDFAQWSAAWRAWQAMSKLGGAVISAVSDTVTLVNNLRFQGRPLLQTWSDVATGYLAGRGDQEAREVAFLYGEGYDALIGGQLERFSATDAPPGWIANGLSTYFRWTGLSGFTDVGRSVAIRIMAADMGAHAKQGWGELPTRYRSVLEAQGIGEAKWELMRQATWKAPEGEAVYMTPDRLRELSDEQLDGYLRQNIASAEGNIAARRQQIEGIIAREQEWVDRRLGKLQAYIDRGQQRLDQLRQQGRDRADRNIAALEVRQELLKAQVEEAAARADFEGARRGLTGQDQVRRFLDEVEGGREAVRVATRTDRFVERLSRGQYGTGERLGRRIGNAERRVKELEAKVRQADRDAFKTADAEGERFRDAVERRTEEAKAFIAKMDERRAQREEEIAGLPARLERQIAKLREDLRDELELDLRRFMVDEASFGVIETDAATRKFTTGGRAPGTLGGEVIRAFMEFKGFPIAFSQRVIGRAIYGGPGGADRYFHMAEMMAGLFVAGLFAMWMKDLAKGRSPKELIGDDGLNWKTVAAAFVQSGGAGIYGDFLFAEANRFGQGIERTVSGPAFGEFFAGIELLYAAKDGETSAGRSLNFALRNTPYLNLFYVRPALDYLIINELREAASPGFIRRQKKRLKEDYGQTMLWQ